MYIQYTVLSVEDSSFEEVHYLPADQFADMEPIDINLMYHNGELTDFIGEPPASSSFSPGLTFYFDSND